MSRDIDIQVRDHIISRPDPTRCACCNGPLKALAEDGCESDHCVMRASPERKETNPAPYSTDIAAAWQIVQALHPVPIELFYHPSHNAWQCNMGNGPLTRRYRMTQDAWQPTAPLAICVAALNAVGLAVAEEQEPPLEDGDEQAEIKGGGD